LYGPEDSRSKVPIQQRGPRPRDFKIGPPGQKHQGRKGSEKEAKKKKVRILKKTTGRKYSDLKEPPEEG